MRSVLIIREGRILLEQASEHEGLLSLKICVGKQIYRANKLIWSEPCNRWETQSDIILNYSTGSSVELELYYPSVSIPKVIGEAIIDNSLFLRGLEEELKIALTYDGIVKGWLYCQIGIQGEHPDKIESKYLSIDKINFSFLEEHENQFSLEIFQNTESIFQKKFFLNITKRSIFPQIKNKVRYSDVIKIVIFNSQIALKHVSFLCDNIKRGKTAHYEAWIRNNYNNKVGEVKVEYFLQNLFLQNDRKLMSRKAMMPKTLNKMHSLLSDTTESSRNQKGSDSQTAASLTPIRAASKQSAHFQLVSSNLAKIRMRRIEKKSHTAVNSSQTNLQQEENKNSENVMPCHKKKIVSSKSPKKDPSYYFFQSESLSDLLLQ